jgi:branched-chain amino acid transport system ATP-binding protein
MSSLVLKGVGKRFGGLQAVTPFDMEIARGKITGLIGPNGAGKTTVVNLITGVYKLSSGTIKFGDIDLTEAPRHEVARAGLARTFQTIRLLPDATVVANVMIGMYRHQKASLVSQLFGLPSSRAETRRFRDEVYHLLDRFGMTKYADYPAGALSYGDQRRVEMMRALALCCSTSRLPASTRWRVRSWRKSSASWRPKARAWRCFSSSTTCVS